MRSKFKFIPLVAVLLLTACMQQPTNKFSDAVKFEAKEQLYLSTNNYGKLIELYREALQKKDSEDVRFKLANMYYQINDSISSDFYLAPLLKDKTNKSYPKYLILSLKNAINRGQFQSVLDRTNILPKESLAEFYNLRGIAFANLGVFDSAYKEFEKSRDLFINDTTALNNLATLDMIQGKYDEAVKTLLVPYYNGLKDKRFLNTLILALAKKGDFDTAIDIIRREKIDENPEKFVYALSKVQLTSSVLKSLFPSTNVIEIIPKK